MSTTLKIYLLSIVCILGLGNRCHATIKDVQVAIKEQVAAWNTGDLETAMTYYWNSPNMLWVNRAGVQKGYADVLEAYKIDFKDRSKMGKYSIDELYAEELKDGLVLYVVRWKIELDGKKLMGGISSQLWKLVDGKWVVTVEHGS